MKLFGINVIVAILVLVFGFFGLSRVNATLGPVHVELNVTGERLGPSRANTATAFRIYFRINQNIEVHDWVKIWFPIQEASNDPNDICGEPLVVKGYDESPRFVPNEKYFEKYNNPDEKKVGKLYEVLDEHESSTKFFGCEPCDESEDNCRLVEDPSGLGCWIMGMVLPALPKDRSDRKEILARIIHCSDIAIPTCCSECKGYPIIIQSWNESSYQINSPVGVEAWRQGYNPIDFMIAKSAGFITPATPGRYRIKIATQREPTPVESESFVLPCSEITKPKFSFMQTDKEGNGEYVVKFNVGEGGALDKGYSSINIKFPDCIKLNHTDETWKDTTINGQSVRKKGANLEINKNDNSLLITLPCNVDNTGNVTIRIKREALKNNCIDPFTILIGTSSEPEMIESSQLITHKVYENFDSLIKNLNLTSQISGKKTGISFILDARELTVNKYTEFRITLPEGSYIPKNIQNGQFLINNLSVCKLERQNNNSISLWMNTKRFIDQYSLRFIRFDLTEYARIQNPIDIGGYQFSVSIDGQIPVKSNYYEITKR